MIWDRVAKQTVLNTPLNSLVSKSILVYSVVSSSDFSLDLHRNACLLKSIVIMILPSSESITEDFGDVAALWRVGGLPYTPHHIMGHSLISVLIIGDHYEQGFSPCY